MKKNILIGLVVLLIIGLVVGFIAFKPKDKIDTTGGEDIFNPTIPTVSEIELDAKQYINQLEKVKIKGTNDTLMITEKIRLGGPDEKEYEKGTTISFANLIPYTFTVDGVEYPGTYTLGDREWYNEKAVKFNNPKYGLRVSNLTKDGDIEVVVTTK